MNTQTQTAPLCVCCEEKPGVCTDPDLGKVCGECFSLLHQVEHGLKSPLFQLSGCGRNRDRKDKPL